jgi:hypothetical protein
MQMKKTAVEWFFDNLKNHEIQAEHLTLYEQAKEMEKEQIEDAHIEGQRVFDEYPHTQWTNDQAESYYNKTYNKQ